MQEVLERVVSAKLGLQPYTHRVRIHGATLHEDNWETLEEGILYAPVGLGWEAAYLPAGLPKICLWNHPLKSANVVFFLGGGGSISCCLTCISGLHRQGRVNDRLRNEPVRALEWHTTLWSPSPYEVTLRPVGHSAGFQDDDQTWI